MYLGSNPRLQFESIIGLIKVLDPHSEDEGPKATGGDECFSVINLGGERVLTAGHSPYWHRQSSA